MKKFNTLKDFNFLQKKFIEISSLKNDVLKFNKNILEKMNSKIVEQISYISKKFDELPESVKEYISKLYNQGWYVDINRIYLPTMKKLANDIDSGNIQNVDKKLSDKYNSFLDEISVDFISLFPKRKSIFEKSIKAHNNKDFELSIPVLLTQIDGICKEKAEGEFFLRERKKEKTPKTAKYFEEKLENPYLEMFLEPLLKTTPISYNKNERMLSGESGILNRHMLLHGEDINYANETNSCKVISLLSYLISIFKDIDKYPDTKT